MQSLIHGLLFSLLFIHQSIASHPPSPCPDVFSYEGSEPENNRWYGEISLRTDESLVGIRLDIELDRRADLMVSWMGEISSNDNMKFTILNLNQKLKPGPPVLSRIMTKFNRTTGSPKLRFIRLNGRKICPDETSHSEFEEPPRPSRRPDPEFEENGGDSLNEFPIGNTGNNNNRPYTQPNNNNDNNNYNNNNNNNNWPNTDSNVNNNRPVYKPPVMTTEEPYTTKKPIKTTTTTRSPYENNNNNNNKPNNNNNNNNNNNSNRPNNNHNTVTLQASSANSNGEINGVINELLQNEKNGNKTVIITVIENNQHNRPNPVNSDNNRPVSGENSGQSKPNSNRPTERPDNHGDNSYNSNVNVVTNSGTCGEVKLAIPLVTSGQSTHRGQWPWHVALYMTEGINLSYNCGGSLVSKNKVITAAHCVTNKRTDAIVNSSKIIVYLGKHHQLQYSDEYVQTKQVIRINVFPTYNSSNYLGDLAVLTLSSDVELTKYVNPVCLWEDSNELSDLVGKEGTVVGWGFNENDSPTEELKMAKMPVVSHEVCLRSYPQFYAEFTSDKTYCAGFRNGTSVCNGDSGGGMVFNKNSKWYLRGVVSLAVAKEGLRVCDTKRFVVFTDVAKYLDFVRKNIQR